MAKGPDLSSSSQARTSASRKERPRETYGDDTMGDDLLARDRRDIHHFPVEDWQVAGRGEPNIERPRAPEEAWTAGMPWWGRQKGRR